MKKFLGIVISALMVLTLGACEKKTDDSSSKIVVQEPSLENKSLGNVLRIAFDNIVKENPDMSVQGIADALLANEAVTFKGMTMPVENGLLTGFGNFEVNGFKEGIMFGPLISSIPFIGYIFKVDDNTNLAGFMSDLNDNADKRWNVCTEADSVNIENEGYTVFFLMSPDSLEDEGDSMEEDENSSIEEAEKERAELESMEEEAEKNKEELDSMEDEASNGFIEEAEKKLQEVKSIVEEAKKLKEE